MSHLSRTATGASPGHLHSTSNNKNCVNSLHLDANNHAWLPALHRTSPSLLYRACEPSGPHTAFTAVTQHWQATHRNTQSAAPVLTSPAQTMTPLKSTSLPRWCGWDSWASLTVLRGCQGGRSRLLLRLLGGPIRRQLQQRGQTSSAETQHDHCQFCRLN